MDLQGVGATFFVVILTVSMFAPAVSATPTVNTENSTDEFTANAVTTDPSAIDVDDRPPVVLKATAVDSLSSLNNSQYAERANESVSGTFAQYRGPARVTSRSVFSNDSDAVRQLGNHVQEHGDTATALNASILIAAADNETARQAIQDAERALSSARSEIDHRGTIRSSESHLQNARRAYDRGLEALNRAGESSDRQAFNRRAQAIDRFRKAWHQSQKVLQRLSGRVDPEVNITEHADPVRNGSANRTVQATVRSLNPGTIGSATVLVDGNERVQTNVSTVGVGPGENVTIQETVHLSDQTANVTVVVNTGATSTSSSEESKPGNRGNGKGNGPPSSRSSGNEDGQASATLLLDGDGLNDTYERTVLGTDPLDPDSDATATSADEAGNGIIDGKEDFDGDELDTLKELKIGTDPLENDTDSDDLEDSTELWVTGTDPTQADTDSDGTLDGAEDPDEDNLGNAEEIAEGTFPQVADSDGDGIDDGTELNQNTNPRDEDTDNDGLNDSVELTAPFNTDPTDEDTDDDGVLDGNETYTTTKEDESLGVTVDVTGDANVVASTTVDEPGHARYNEESPLAQNVSIAEGPFANFEADGDIDNATMTFEYDESQISSNESAVAVYRFNETIQTYERLPSTVDPQSDTVTAETSHFSTYTVMDAGAYQDFLTELRNAVVSGNAGVVYQEDFEGVTLNNSDWECNNQPRGGRYKNTPTKGYCEISNGWATVEEETNRRRYLNKTVTLNVPQDSTVLATARVKAHIDAQWADASLKLIVANSGRRQTIAKLNNDWSGQDRTIDTVTTANVSAFAGETVNISIQADGRHTYQRQNTTSWMSIENITISGGELEDKDNDGIVDLQEQHLPLRNYGVVNTSTNPNTGNDVFPKGWDTDDDGLSDGREVFNTSKVLAPENQSAMRAIANSNTSSINPQANEEWFEDTSQDGFYGYPWISLPTKADTDGDGLDDGEEVLGQEAAIINTTTQNGDSVHYRRAKEHESPDDTPVFTSDPRKVHSDQDGLNDSVEARLDTDPRNEQTYYLTTEHEELLEQIDPDSSLGSITIQKVGLSEVDLSDPELTDSTDDFDIVLTDGTSIGQFWYRPLDRDRVLTTDRWVTNEQELDSDPAGGSATYIYEGYETDPWDPDSDDDGLTDGQEMYGVSDGTETYATDPTDPDTDGDGYWDGWIGVRGVGASDNVILYKDRLQRRNITGDDIVQEQVNYHPINVNRSTTSAMGAMINGQNVHSNVHIGERQWGTDPTENSDTPNPQVRIEVDYHTDNTGPLQNDAWRQSIEDNYAMYGIDVQFLPSDQTEVIDFQNPPYLVHVPGSNPSSNSWRVESPFSRDEIYAIRNYYSNSSAGTNGDDSLYMFVANATRDPDWDLLNTTQSGVRWNGDDPTGFDRDDSEWIAVFSHGLNPGLVPLNANTSRKQRAAAHKTAVHEIGHVLNIGENEPAEQASGTEIYSGSREDPTIERIENRNNAEIEHWSVMSSGTRPGQYVKPTYETYFAFSIEELLTISTDDTQVSGQ